MACVPSATPPVKVFLADPSVLVRSRVRELLAGGAFAVVGEGTTAADCIGGIVACGPDVVVLEVRLRDGTGLQVLRAVRPLRLAVAFVVFSNSAAPAYRTRYLEAGAAHFLDKSSEFDRLAACLAAAAGQARWH